MCVSLCLRVCMSCDMFVVQMKTMNRSVMRGIVMRKMS